MCKCVCGDSCKTIELSDEQVIENFKKIREKYVDAMNKLIDRGYHLETGSGIGIIPADQVRIYKQRVYFD